MGNEAAPRTGGDRYQHLYSWREILQLLDPKSPYMYAHVEDPNAGSADDVSFHPKPGNSASPRYIQVKWHGNLGGAYSIELLLERDRRQSSLLEKLFHSWCKLSGDVDPEIWLVSNWGPDPELGHQIRSRDYSFSERFLNQVRGDKGNGIGAELCSRLDTHPDKLLAFFRSLRLQLGLGDSLLENDIDGQMALYGLKTGSAARADALDQVFEWIQDRSTPVSITAEVLRDAISRRGLWNPSGPPRQASQGEILRRYLQSVLTNHGSLAPLLQRGSDMPLIEHVFLELKMTERSDVGRGLVKLSIRELAELDADDEAAPPRRWVVLGDPGLGKTTLMRHLAFTLAKEHERTERWIPVYVASKELASGPSLFQKIERRLSAARPAAQFEDFLVSQAQDGRIVFLFDGLDEVPAGIRAEVLEIIQGIASQYPQSTVIVASRPIGYSGIGGGFQEASILPLERSDRLRFLTRWLENDGVEEAAARAQRAVIAMDAERSIRELSSVPLYLTLIALLLSDGVEPRPRRSQLYDQILDYLLKGKHRPNARRLRPMPVLNHVRRALRFVAEGMLVDDLLAQPVLDIEEKLHEPEATSFASPILNHAEWGGNMMRFLTDVSERTAILGPHDGEDEAWRFLHKSFLESLVAESLGIKFEAQGMEPILAHLHQLPGDEGRWAEPLALLAGRIDNADALVEGLVRVNRKLGLRALSTAEGLRDETLLRILGLSEGWEERSQVILEIADQVDDPQNAVLLLRRIAERTTDGNDLYFVDRALTSLSERRIDAADLVSKAAIDALRSSRSA